jgi:hypothetical protein
LYDAECGYYRSARDPFGQGWRFFHGVAACSRYFGRLAAAACGDDRENWAPG